MSNEWIDCWESGQTPWHFQKTNSLLVKGFPNLVSHEPTEGKTVFVPLCGKSVDMKWLYDQGLNVIGVELADKAIIEFFKECEMEYLVENHENYDVYISNDKRMKLFRSDLFILNDSHYGGKFDYIWDRGSMIAIATADKQKYVDLISRLMKTPFVGFLEVFEFDKSLTAPMLPYFKEDLVSLYGAKFEFEEVSRVSGEDADFSLGNNDFTVLYKFSRK